MGLPYKRDGDKTRSIRFSHGSSHGVPLIVLSDLRSFTKLAAGTAMMFILEKQNDDFMTGKLNFLRSSLKAITYQLSLIISLPRAITSNGIILKS